ncbi:glycosyltransferase, partial [Spirochaetota bacterium]
MNGHLVSIITITYNHEQYIRDTLENILNQKTDFEFELIIANDCSADKTHEVISEIIDKDLKGIKIKYFNNKINIGMMQNFLLALKQSKGKYITICEGDDYWIDPYKLQKQVDFLEANKEYSICFHPVENFYQDENSPPYIFPDKNRWKQTYPIEELINDNLMNTCSVLYRWQFYDKPLPDWFSNHYTGDYQLHLLHAYYGKIGIIPEVMARYRIHSHGIWSSTKEHNIIGRVKDRISLLQDYNIYTDKLYNESINISINKYRLTLIHNYLNKKQKNKAHDIYLANKPYMSIMNKLKFIFHYYSGGAYSLIRWIK